MSNLNNELNLIGTKIKENLAVDCARVDLLVLEGRSINEINAIIEDFCDFCDANNFNKKELAKFACVLLINSVDFTRDSFKSDFKLIISTLIKNLNN